MSSFSLIFFLINISTYIYIYTHVYMHSCYIIPHKIIRSLGFLLFKSRKAPKPLPSRQVPDKLLREPARAREAVGQVRGSLSLSLIYIYIFFFFIDVYNYRGSISIKVRLRVNVMN